MRVIEYVESSTSTLRCFREEAFVSVRELSESERNNPMCWKTFKSIPLSKLELVGDKYGADVFYSDTPYKDIVAQLKSNSMGGKTQSDEEYQRHLEVLQRMG